MKAIKHKARDLKMFHLYMDKKKTLEWIGEKFGFTKQRVGQILWQFPKYVKRGYKQNNGAVLREWKCENCGKNHKTYLKGKRRFCDPICLSKYLGKKRAAVTERKCARCKKIKPIWDFYRRAGKDPRFGPPRKMAYCKRCFTKMCWDPKRKK